MSQAKRASLLGFVSALVGGAVVALLLVGFDLVGNDESKTVVQQAPIAGKMSRIMSIGPAGAGRFV